MTEYIDGGNIEEGHYRFQCRGVEKISTGAGWVHNFVFTAYGDGFERKYSERLFLSQAIPLVKALDAVEVEKPRIGLFDDWHERIKGKFIEADIVYEEDRKDSSKSWPRLKNITKATSDGTIHLDDEMTPQEIQTIPTVPEEDEDKDL
jgi:hypothetical protein